MARQTVLVLGLTGGYGKAMARALLTKGYNVRALVRDLSRGQFVARRLPGLVEFVQGDVLHQECLDEAMEGVCAVVHGINAPYEDWDPFVVDVARRVGQAAARVGATILFPGNVYNFAAGVDLHEGTPMAPTTALGQLRVEVEEVLAAATESGAKVIVLRGGDFFGMGSSSTWMAHMTERLHSGGPIVYPGPLDLRHQWAYLPDFATAHVALMERKERLAPHTVFHFEGHAVTGHKWVETIRRVLGEPARPVRSVPWWLFRLGSWVSPMCRALHSMRYLWHEEVLMCGEALGVLIDVPPRTKLEAAIRQELVYRQRHQYDGDSESLEVTQRVPVVCISDASP